MCDTCASSRSHIINHFADTCTWKRIWLQRLKPHLKGFSCLIYCRASLSQLYCVLSLPSPSRYCLRLIHRTTGSAMFNYCIAIATRTFWSLDLINNVALIIYVFQYIFSLLHQICISAVADVTLLINVCLVEIYIFFLHNGPSSLKTSFTALFWSPPHPTLLDFFSSHSLSRTDLLLFPLGGAWLLSHSVTVVIALLNLLSFL